MAAIKSLAVSSEKWVRRAGQAGPDYAAGIQTPRRDWEKSTLDATKAQADGVREAINNKSFEKGVAKAGTEKWKRKAQSVGVDRYGPGVEAAKSDYSTGFAPFRSVIENITLPPRGPKGDPRNFKRVEVIGKALHDAKTKGV